MTGRHLTTAVTLAVLCVVLVVGLVVGVNKLFAPLPEDPLAVAPEPSPTCQPTSVEKGERLHSRAVVVSVFNAGTRAGLADQTLAALTRRGFKEGEVGNAPADTRVRFARVWTTAENDAAARLVARQLGRKVRVVVGKEDLGEGVDVLVGNGFAGLVKAPRWIAVRKTQQVCVDVPTPAS
jgi:hypothetical protein